MNRQLLLSEFLTTPWALMPERLQAMAGVLTRWSAGEPPTDEAMFQIQSERVLRDTRKQMAAANAGSGIAVLPLYGVVTQRGNMVDDISGPGSTSTQQFTSALRQVLADDTVGQILIDIDSPGGSVFDGYTMFREIQSLRDRGVVVTATITGMAASMASVICMACDSIRMVPHGRMMIHDASNGAYGNAEAMRKMADLLDGISGDIAAIYADRTGKTVDAVRAMMKKETWMNAKDAKSLVAHALLEGESVAGARGAGPAPAPRPRSAGG